MRSHPDTHAGHDRFELKIAGGTPGELVAVASAVIVAITAAAALLLTTTAALEAAPTGALAGMSASAFAQRPFHERYPVDPRGEQVDPPSF
jgi:hypothetical protein